MDKKPLAAFIVASIVIVGVFFAYRPWIEQAIIDAGEAVYVAVSRWFISRDQQVPTIGSIISGD